jgi:hypothetical protein
MRMAEIDRNQFLALATQKEKKKKEFASPMCTVGIQRLLFSSKFK